MHDMINPQKGIDLMNNNSIINIILFAVTIFQHSPLNKKVILQHHQERERETTSTTSGTSNDISINHRIFSHHQYHHPQQGSRIVSSSFASTWISITLIHHLHQ